MSCGDRFVETLRKLGYHKAPKLDGADFDWLFENTDDKAFLNWFCTNATEQNVVSDEKLQAFNNLNESGYAILDEKALDEVLKTCKSSKNVDVEEMDIGMLEEELKTLQKLKALHVGRRNKIQIMASSNSHLQLKLKHKEEEESKALKEELSGLEIANNKLNRELQAVVESVQKLISFFTICKAESELSSQPFFLSQMDIEKYLECEKRSTVQLTSVSKCFFDGISKYIGHSKEICQIVQENASTQSDGDGKCKEMMKLQSAYICAKNKLIQAKAKNASLEAGLKWAEDTLCAKQNKDSHKEVNLKARILSLKEEVLQIQKHIDLINHETLPGLVRENSQLINMPILKGEYDCQVVRQNLYLSRQDAVCNHLMKQKASFELLELGYELELRKHSDVYQQLRKIIEDLKLSNEKLEERLKMMSDPNFLPLSTPRNNVDSKDVTAHRLYELLDDDKTQKLFRTYNGLESAAQKLNQNITSLKDQLVVSEKEYSLFISKLDADLKSLGEFTYPEGKTVLLNTTELSSEFQQLDSRLEKLNHILLEILGDLKVKRNILDSNKLHNIEKQLYVHFFKNEDYLRNIVENLESQTDILTST